MEKQDVIVWFNKENLALSSFVNPFIDDLKKCFGRFGRDVNMHTNPYEKISGYSLVLLSDADSTSESYLKMVKGVNVESKCKIIQIEPLRSTDGFETNSQPVLLWNKHYITDEVTLFRRDNPGSQVSYWEKLIDVVVDIIGINVEPESSTKSEYVYLSIEQISINAERENIQRDLNDLGIKILPSKAFSGNVKESTKQIIEALELSRLIIHIIPPTYNVFFANEKLSLTEHQCNVSAEFLRNVNNKPKRIIWIPSAYEITDEENQVFVEKIQRDISQTKDTTILKSSIEDLKKYYRQLLQLKPDNQLTKDGEVDVYVVSDSYTNGLVGDAQKMISTKGLLVNSNTKGISYNKHMQILAKSRSLVLCYSKRNDQWLEVKINEILKSKGMDNSRPFEKLILWKADEEVNTKPYESYFSQVIFDIKELANIPFS